MTRFIAIGECMVELSPTDTEGDFRLNFAGDTFNTAWYVRRCLPEAARVSYLTAVGEDDISRRMTAFMEAQGIETDLVGHRADRTVGLYMISLSAGERSFAYWRETSAARTLIAEVDRLPSDLGSQDMVYFSGITLAILGPQDRDRLNAAMTRLREAGVTVAFDPNIRPRLWPGDDEMRSAIATGAGASSIVLPSFDDETAAFGDEDPQATARRYLRDETPLVVVKNGTGEMVVGTHEGFERLAPETVAKPVDTTAAGDSFNAGFLAAYLRGAEPTEAALEGAALAARVVQERGALIESMA